MRGTSPVEIPLRRAAAKGNIASLEWARGNPFFWRLWVDFKDANKRTILHEAALNQKIESVRFLLENNANPDIKDKNEDTPLLYALKNGADVENKAIKELFLYSDLNLRFEKFYNGTMLHDFIWKAQSSISGDSMERNLKILEKLIEYGADPSIKQRIVVRAYPESGEVDIDKRYVYKSLAAKCNSDCICNKLSDFDYYNQEIKVIVEGMDIELEHSAGELTSHLDLPLEIKERILKILDAKPKERSSKELAI